jgi:hypothetical protein
MILIRELSKKQTASLKRAADNASIEKRPKPVYGAMQQKRSKSQGRSNLAKPMNA